MTSERNWLMSKIGVIDVGGGTRDIYGSGIFDFCSEKGIVFDYGIGVSAGSANIGSYMSGQIGRNYRYFNSYAFRKEYMSLSNLLKTGSYLGLDYIFSTLANSDGEDPWDYEACLRFPAEFITVATDADTGKPVYFSKEDIQKDRYDFFKASCCVPGVCKPYRIGTGRYFDGGISDPIPLRKAFEAGCDKLVLILTKPKTFFRKPNESSTITRMVKGKYPKTAEAMLRRPAAYNRALKAALALEKKGRVLILAPENIGKMKTLTKDHKQLDMLYQMGRKDAEKIIPFLKG